MQPETAIDDWRQWGAGLAARPVLKVALSGGRSNESYLLDSGIGKLVLRINGDGSLLPGNSHDNEIRVWQAASKQGLAPPLLFVDGENRYLVSAYIHTDLPQPPQNSAAVIDLAFKLLQGCHQLKVDAPQIDYSNHIENYWQVIEAKTHRPDTHLAEQRKFMQQALESLLNSNTPTGLCHHDPVIQNFVGTADRLYLIDWEYAATGLPIMDYAALATEWQLNDATILANTGFDPELLTIAKSLYQYMCSLWEAATT